MAVPKRKVSKSRRNMRSANKALKPVCVNIKEDGNWIVPHIAEKREDGFYYKGSCVKKFRVRKKQQNEEQASQEA